MLTGKNSVLAWFDDSRGNYWYIYNYGQASNGANIAYASDQEENITHEKARASLERALGFISGRFDIVSTETASRKPKGDWKISFQINQVEERNSNVSGFGTMQAVQGFTKEDVQAEVAKALEAHEQKRTLEQSLKRIAELEKENKELQKDDPWDKIGEVVVPLLQHYVGSRFQASQVAGMPPASDTQTNNAHFEETATETVVTNEIKLTDDEETRLANVISILHTVAPAVWLSKLERLAAMVQQNPAMLNMIN